MHKDCPGGLFVLQSEAGRSDLATLLGAQGETLQEAEGVEVRGLGEMGQFHPDVQASGLAGGGEAAADTGVRPGAGEPLAPEVAEPQRRELHHATVVRLQGHQAAAGGQHASGFLHGGAEIRDPEQDVLEEDEVEGRVTKGKLLGSAGNLGSAREGVEGDDRSGRPSAEFAGNGAVAVANLQHVVAETDPGASEGAPARACQPGGEGRGKARGGEVGRGRG